MPAFLIPMAFAAFVAFIILYDMFKTKLRVVRLKKTAKKAAEQYTKNESR